jgi:Coenzyme PQQ synthesis protein D (PqqD)
VEAPRPLDPSTRLRLAPAATRRLGSDLLVNAGGATAPVQRLMGTGAELWECFARGLSVGEAVTLLAQRTGAPADVERNVVEFGTALVRAGLAEPLP